MRGGRGGGLDDQAELREGDGVRHQEELRSESRELREGDGVGYHVDIEELVKRVVAEKIEVQITIEPDRTEINIQPWKPYEMKCPYANGAKEGVE